MIVYFENTACSRCGARLGFVPGRREMVAFDPPQDDPAGAWPCRWDAADGNDAGRPSALRPCANHVDPVNCNWMLDDGDPALQCRSCRLTAVVPDLGKPENGRHWAAIERAKRRLVLTLDDLGLAPRPKRAPDDRDGLAFHLLEALPGGPPVMTGHEDGRITLNVAEADDLQRETIRVSMGEPVRTLLGHLRHEIGHHLQQRWLEDTPAMDECRAVFGDERASYDAALATYYAQGAPPDWPQRHVSAYASAHPWEDWAETCAHLLLVVDAVHTASAWGLRLEGPAARTDTSAAAEPAALPVEDLVLQHWLPVAQFLNAMNRSLGLPDAYPFLLPPTVLQKMGLVHRLLREAAARRPETSPPAEPGAQPAADAPAPPAADIVAA
ncbi:hypothetical protein ISF6_0829 [Piscinibacter sakaiensis]|uniref:Zinc-ribbon domain-containing protein n=1 Tax=Piscinibacter sakaiensis TaxID=1547922 RepID=A0A0K8NXY9_PISS1|nr:hypothetical protein ISF6_0829 [Piscinibacter sakaiensis]